MKNHTLLPGATRKVFTVLVILALCSTLAQAASPTPSDKMTYQGYLVDANGAALAPNLPANYPVIFRIYDASQGGALIWSEQQIVTIDKGHFSVVLGEGTQYQSEPRDALSSVFKEAGASDRYLGISVTIGATTSEILPRLRLLPAPYAFLAKSANALVGADGLPLVTTASGGVLNTGGSIQANGNISTSGDLSAVGNLSAGGNLNAAGAIAGNALNVSGTATANTFSGFGIIPIGGIIMWSGAVGDIPAGWALCDGQPHDGRPTPDLRNRFVIGAGQTYAVGASAGSTTKTLSTANIPSHNHTVTDSYFVQNTSVGWGTIALDYVGHSATTTRTSSSTGSGTAFDIMPPYYALAYIMRTR